MAAICELLDEHQGIGYLETDRPGNVRLYRRGGFEVVAEQPVLGVSNWFMLRRPCHPERSEGAAFPGNEADTSLRSAIGRASWWERGGPYGESSMGAGLLK